MSLVLLRGVDSFNVATNGVKDCAKERVAGDMQIRKARVIFIVISYGIIIRRLFRF